MQSKTDIILDRWQLEISSDLSQGGVTLGYIRALKIVLDFSLLAEIKSA